MVLGLFLVLRTVRVWLSAYKTLTPVIQAYVLVFIPDCLIVAVYLPRSIYALIVGALYTSEGQEPLYTRGGLSFATSAQDC